MAAFKTKKGKWETKTGQADLLVCLMAADLLIELGQY